MPWKTITVPLRDGAAEIKVWVPNDKSLLGINRPVINVADGVPVFGDDAWTITHIPTGYRCTPGSNPERLRVAKLILAALQPDDDAWRFDDASRPTARAAELSLAVRKRRHDFENFKGAVI